MSKTPLRVDQLNGHEGLFGWTINSNGTVVIYVEDDEAWHARMVFNRHWLKEFYELAATLLPLATPRSNP